VSFINVKYGDVAGEVVP